MRAVTGVWLAGLAVACSVCRAEPQFPYQVAIGDQGADVRSGPGRKYYATDRLEAGCKIEVYRHEPGGWLAIRPPSTSFSLVQRSDLQTADGSKVARVRREGAACRVGSRVAEVEDFVSHVRLRKDELVELYRESADGSSPSTDEDRRWISIWPPAGEFRWVHANNIGDSDSTTDDSSASNTSPASDKSETDSSRSGEDSSGWQLRPLTSPAVSSTETASRGGDGEHDEREPGTSSTDGRANEPMRQTDTKHVPAPSETVRVPPEREQARVAQIERRNKSERPAAPNKSATPKKPEEPKRSVQPDESADDSSTEDVSETPPRRWRSRSGATADDLDSLELDLSMMVAREMRAWRLDSLSERVRDTLGRLEDESDRVQARRLLARISEFEHLLDRAAAATESGSVGDSFGATSSEADVETAHGNTVAGVTYDGTGWLVPVHASKGTVPPYALLDAQGDVLQYISPTPGLNLQRYVRKQIGIFGNRGYIPSLNKPHVTAQRVVDLDRHLR